MHGSECTLQSIEKSVVLSQRYFEAPGRVPPKDMIKIIDEIEIKQKPRVQISSCITTYNDQTNRPISGEKLSDVLQDHEMGYTDVGESNCSVLGVICRDAKGGRDPSSH